MDGSEEMPAIERKNFPGAEYQNMDLRVLAFAESTFDGIWNVSVLLHLDTGEVHGPFEKFHEILRTESPLFVAMRSYSENTEIVEKASEGGRPRVRYYMLETLEQMPASTGFTTIHYTEQPDDNGRPFNYAYLFALKR